MFKTFAAVLLATAMVAGAAVAAEPSAGAGREPAAATAGGSNSRPTAATPSTAAKLKVAKHMHKHVRKHLRRHRVVRGKARVHEAHQLRRGKTRTSHFARIGKATKAAAKLPATRTSTN